MARDDRTFPSLAEPCSSSDGISCPTSFIHSFITGGATRCRQHRSRHATMGGACMEGTRHTTHHTNDLQRNPAHAGGPARHGTGLGGGPSPGALTSLGEVLSGVIDCLHAAAASCCAVSAGWRRGSSRLVPDLEGRGRGVNKEQAGSVGGSCKPLLTFSLYHAPWSSGLSASAVLTLGLG